MATHLQVWITALSPLLFNCLYSHRKVVAFCWGVGGVDYRCGDGGSELGQPTGEQVQRTPCPSKGGIRLPN